ncbi:hypothetical protein LTR27_001597 [Elasticomyces elasticus]|nr:hypothetical protein LTR27_001597 [Elasticomyces elasticus]
MAAERVFGIMELRESILDLLDERSLLLSQGISRIFASAVKDSAKYQRKLFFTVDEPTAAVSIDDIEVNPLLAERVSTSSYSDALHLQAKSHIFVALKSNFLESPSHTERAYRLKSEIGSWQRMHLLRAGKKRLVTIALGPIRSYDGADYELKLVSSHNITMRYITKSDPFQRQLRIAGHLDYVDKLASRIRVGNLSPAALYQTRVWVMALQRVAGEQYDMFQRADTKASRVADPARDFHRLRHHGFLAAVEELEGQAGEHHNASDFMVWTIRARPELLVIEDEATRHIRWRIAIFGSA